MKIRWKLLILLLCISLAPLIVASGLHRVSARRLGNHLASGTREVLVDSARRYLQRAVQDYGRILHHNKEALELALNIQGREVERRLAAQPPAASDLLWWKDYDAGIGLPEDMAASAKHFSAGPDGELIPMQVTYSQQVYFLVKGTAPEAVADDLARLSTMPEVYHFLYRTNPQMIHWQYTALESGVHTSFPGHGGYPDDYDPRMRLWYLAAKEAGTFVWGSPIVDVTTRQIMLTLSRPVHRPDRTFAGVTSIDVPLRGIFGQLELPAEWSESAETMLVFPGEAGTEVEGELVILVQASYGEPRRDWRAPVELEVLESDDTGQMQALMAEATAGRAGVRRMPYQGYDAFWAYGAGGRHGVFPVVIVPYERVVARAASAEQYVLRKTIEGLRNTGLALLGVVGVVTVIALVSSRSVTRPVRQLAEAARRLSGGDYQARVDIRTGDELQQLGEVFNDTGPKLAEHERMRHALAVAMEVQQHLLPQEAPKLVGFDIAGKSVYCDETGGDYYDFIDLIEIGDGKLGIAVGDVTGHGIAAALLMASARGVLRSHAARHGSDLGELFGVLNEHLVQDTSEGRFMTLFYGVLDAAARSLSWTSGGHDPALWLRRRDGAFEELPNTGVPLGILDEATHTQAGPITLDSGDIVAIGTDGIWEAHNAAGEMFGKARLRDVLSACAERPAQQIYDAVVDAVNQFRGTEPQEDDITLVIIKTLE